MFEFGLAAAVAIVGVRYLLSEPSGPRSVVVGSVVFGAAMLALMGKREVLQQAQARRARLRAEVPHLERDGGYVSSSECRACHPGEHDSWHRSYHRTMTQLATPEAVVAPFEDVELESGGRTYRLSRVGDEFHVDMLDPHAERARARQGGGDDPGRRNARVVMTTGSHYMQTYWVQAPDTREVFNLSWVYDFATSRWLPRESVFLRPPDAGPFKQVWNDNCIQCHSTGPQPRMTEDGADTRVAELGIACEACHGPGEEHVRANHNFLRRHTLHLTGGEDDTIVNPKRLGPRVSAQVCGQCHSKSMIGEPKQWFTGEGLSYRPGDDLTRSRAPVLPASQPDHPALVWAQRGDPEFVDKFFWRDGMIRVSGREYNGMVESECHTAGDLTCISCHEMHGDDPDMQLKPDMRTAAACVQCHEELTGAALPEHTHHVAGSAGSNCLNCHMPYTSYGLLRGLRSHLIDSPTVAATLETGRPNACNICHLDQTLSWTAEHLSTWYGQDESALPLTDEDRRVAASVQWLLRGDAGQRALAAWYFAWQPAREVSGTDWMAAHLVELLVDPYDAVRYIAARTLRTLEAFQDLEYDFVGAQAARAATRDQARARVSAAAGEAAAVLMGHGGVPDTDAIANLLSNRDDRAMDLRE